MPTLRTRDASSLPRVLRGALALGLAATFVVSAPPSGSLGVREAAAQDDVRTRARALADEGQEAFAQKDFAKAVVKFEQALALVKAPTLALALARAQAGQGKLVAAQRTLQGVVLEGTAPNAPPEFKQAVNEANLELAKVQARMPHLVLVVEGADAPEVRLDGELVATVSLGKPRPVDPGSHLVTARQAGYVELEQRVIVEERQTQRVRLELQKLEAGAPVPKPGEGPTVGPTLPPPSVPPAGASDARSSMMGAGIGLLAVGVVGLGLGGLFAGLTAAKHDELAANCPNGVCDPSWEGALSEYRAIGTASPIAFAAGGVLVGASIIVFATMPGKKKLPEARLAPDVKLGLGGRGVVLTF